METLALECARAKLFPSRSDAPDRRGREVVDEEVKSNPVTAVEEQTGEGGGGGGFTAVATIATYLYQTLVRRPTPSMPPPPYLGPMIPGNFAHGI